MEPKLELLQFETDTACNAKCLFCEHPNMQQRGKASWTTILTASYWHTHKAKEICPFGMQEPTLEPRMPAILATQRQFNPKAKLTLYSNMAHYDEAWWRRIVEYELLDTLAVSFSGINQQLYSKLQLPATLKTVESNIKRLIKLKKQYHLDKPEVNLHVIVMPETQRSLKRFIEKWQRILGVNHVGLVHWDSWTGHKPYSEQFESSVWGQPEKDRMPCPRLWKVMTVHSNGNVVSCCLDAHEKEVCGNINSDPQSWYTNKRLNTLRQLHIEGRQSEIDLCRNCTVWKREHTKEWNNQWRKIEVEVKAKPVLSVNNPCIKS